MKRYFLSYCYTLVGIPGEIHYGCALVDNPEHPVARVKRWNKEYPERRYVLLWWQEVGPEAPELDVEI